MDEQTTHDIILDLLPSYIEGLTHERTNEWIQDHLRTCPQCDSCLLYTSDAADD